MTIKAITVPKWGLSMDEGELVEWHISPGDEINVGQEIAEIETSKIAGAVEAAVSGKVRRLVAEEGEMLPVGALMAVLADDNQSDEAIDAFIATFKVEDPDDPAVDMASKPNILSAQVGDMNISYLEVMPPEPENIPDNDQSSEKASEKAPEKIPVILIHGYGGDCNNWLFNQAKLGETHRVIALDLPGHGRSTKYVKDGSVKGLARIVEAFLDSLGIEKAHLIGHSMGAAIALQCAVTISDRVASLSLICPALVGRPVNAGYITGFMQARTRKQLKPVLQQLFSDEKLVTADLVDDVLKYKRLDGVDEALKVIAAAGLTAEKPAFNHDDIAGLHMPISIIWGENDKIIAGTGAHILTGENIRNHQVKDSGHMPHMENAGAVNEILMENL